ncbi:MAG TPA: S-methyl-5'-thioadenosine phosphorylase [Elusimicrobiota bacterium]|nr:S-methyl-5'-thioadenosine phosphorylase [Elusimicrobiota bacterium]
MPEISPSKRHASIAVIGGSGLYAMDDLKNARELRVKTPFGEPSDALVWGELEGRAVVFLPRHGRGHRINPSEVNHRANIFALKSVGVKHIVSVSACGSLKDELKPRDMVVPDQIFDRTKSRACTFFEKGIVAHVGVADPYCPELSKLLYDQAASLGFRTHAGGTYVCIEGPQFSTRAESQVYRSLGFSVIGMTSVPEFKLAREAEVSYASVALVTDYDVWKEEPVTVDMVIGNLKANTANVKRLLKAVVPALPESLACDCHDALRYAIITDPKRIPPKVKKDLKPLIGKYV